MHNIKTIDLLQKYQLPITQKFFAAFLFHYLESQAKINQLTLPNSSLTYKRSDADIELFVNGIRRTISSFEGTKIIDEKTGSRQFSAAYCPPDPKFPQNSLTILLDSGTFTDSRRLSLLEAYNRMYRWERKASSRWGYRIIANYWASYDRIGDSHSSIEAALFIVKRREMLTPRKLILTAQGGNQANQADYINCLRQILDIANPTDIIGLGGWANLGIKRLRIYQFINLIEQAIPLINSANIFQVHLWGVSWNIPLTYLLVLCDRYSIKLTTDSSSSLTPFYKAKTSQDALNKGAFSTNWAINVALQQAKLATLKQSHLYQNLSLGMAYQLSLF